MSRAKCFMGELTGCYSGALDFLGGPLITVHTSHLHHTFAADLPNKIDPTVNQEF